MITCDKHATSNTRFYFFHGNPSNFPHFDDSMKRIATNKWNSVRKPFHTKDYFYWCRCRRKSDIKILSNTFLKTLGHLRSPWQATAVPERNDFWNAIKELNSFSGISVKRQRRGTPSPVWGNQAIILVQTMRKNKLWQLFFKLCSYANENVKIENVQITCKETYNCTAFLLCPFPFLRFELECDKFHRCNNGRCLVSNRRRHKP